ncbi:PTS system, cellobiose-specific IIB component [Enterococcus sp. AZ194]|uniref:PTS sugar transporter subunit IIB n=1 Tax=Enterococcus sp. AZ194 TaxID=2774629 RepID=UPI003F1EB941
MKKIILLCAGGMSTGVLVNNMKKAAAQRGLEVAIDAHPIDAAATVANDADCVLLGPQVSYRQGEVTSAVSCPVAAIDMRSYGMMDGNKTLDQALALIGG